MIDSDNCEVLYQCIEPILENLEMECQLFTRLQIPNRVVPCMVEGLAKPGASHQARLRESRELGLEFVHSQGSMTVLISLTFDNPFTDERGK